jgi:quercetin dioxygenase-like cupin family protein
MSYRRLLRRLAPVALATAMFLWTGSVPAADLDTKNLNLAAIKITLPDKIDWKTNAGGSAQAVLAGDPSKPGLYVVLTKWTAGHMSRPHFHPNDRYIYVISGTWWVGTGPKFDPDKTVPLPAGSFAVHTAKEIHWDGAKQGDCILEIVGMGPATSTGAEQK